MACIFHLCLCLTITVVVRSSNVVVSCSLICLISNCACVLCFSMHTGLNLAPCSVLMDLHSPIKGLQCTDRQPQTLWQTLLFGNRGSTSDTHAVNMAAEHGQVTRLDSVATCRPTWETCSMHHWRAQQASQLSCCIAASACTASAQLCAALLEACVGAPACKQMSRHDNDVGVLWQVLSEFRRKLHPAMQQSRFRGSCCCLVAVSSAYRALGFSSEYIRDRSIV